jgi:hypothetical protein
MYRVNIHNMNPINKPIKALMVHQPIKIILTYGDHLYQFKEIVKIQTLN